MASLVVAREEKPCVTPKNSNGCPSHIKQVNGHYASFCSEKRQFVANPEETPE
jgi:hypothetical protein